MSNTDTTNSSENLTSNAAFMDKYSRQIGAYGIEAMSKLITLKALIVGIRGVGVETAKNLILAGPGEVTVLDNEHVEIRDLGSNFFLSEEDVGAVRSKSCISKLQELNTHTKVRAHIGELTEELILQQNIVVYTSNSPIDVVTRWNDFCHENNIAFIYCGVRGLSGFIFSDFGNSFTIKDATGENAITRLITHISNEEEGIVTLLGAHGETGGRMHGLEENNHDGVIEISDVEGMEEINGKTFTVKMHQKNVMVKGVTKKVFDPYRLKIGDTTSFGKYVNGGVATQVKLPFQKQYRKLAENLTGPVAPDTYGLAFTDGSKFGRGEHLHFAFLALWRFQSVHGRFPHPNDDNEANEVYALAQQILGEHKEILEKDETKNVLMLESVEEAVVKNVALYSVVDFQPLCAFFGGIVAQEIVKLTGKFSPINQWLHFDCFEVIPDDKLSLEETSVFGSRYDDYIMVIGKTLHDKLRNSRTFLVGCGALGCEFLKNFALAGIATAGNGLITTTDNDRIEISNLNRQFLFREHNVKQAKSLASAEAVKKMNSDLRINPLEAHLSPLTEDQFSNEFWESLDFVTNALDNVKARLYVDSRCVFYQKPLLESGTLGTKCNVQVIIPHLTCSYADGPKDSEDDNIPMCTLRNFPSLIEHCIEWSRAQFFDLFVEPIGEVKKFLDDKEAYFAAVRAETIENPNKGQAASNTVNKIETLKLLKSLLNNVAVDITFEKCLKFAFDQFNKLFRDRILQLIHTFPENKEDDGRKFWTGDKRFPHAAFFDANNATHLAFVISTANIIASNFGLVSPPEKEVLPADHQYRSIEYSKSILSTFKAHEWFPTDEKILLEGEEEKKEVEVSDDKFSELRELINELSNISVKGDFEPAEFEKDEDGNFHIDFISSASNLRAENYRITQATRHKCKMIAGKIIPAIATTTAAVTGMVMIELFKVLQGNKKLSAFKDSSNNLGLNLYTMLEPSEPVKAKDEYDPVEMCNVICKPAGFTKWDRILISGGGFTLQQFLDEVKAKTELNVEFLAHEVSDIEGPARGLALYDINAFSKEMRDLFKSKLDSSFVDWIQERYSCAPVKIITPSTKYIELRVNVSDDNGVIYKVPRVVYQI